MSRSIRRPLWLVVAGLLAGAAVALFLSGWWRGQPAEGPLRIAVNVWPGYAHAFLARDLRLFERHGVVVELVLNQEISQSVEQYKDGEVAGLFNVLPDVIKLAATGFPTKVVYVCNDSVSGDVIVGRPEFASLADLRGRVVGFEGLHSFSHLFVLRALERASLAETEVEFADVPAMGVLEALEAGRIDAGHTWEPITSRALARGYRVLAEAGDTPGIITDVLAFRAEVVARRPAAVQGVVDALLEARERLRSDPDGAVARMAAAVGMTPAEMTAGLAGIEMPDRAGNRAAFRLDADGDTLYRVGGFITRELAARGQLEPQFDVRGVLEPRFVEGHGR